MKIGNRLKLLRKERKMTLEELSKKSGVQIATLSRIEHDIMTGTLNSHINICRTLGVGLADFYRDLENDGKTIALIRKKEREIPSVAPKESTIELLTTRMSEKNMMPVLIHIKKSGKTPKEENRVGVERFVYLLKGNVCVKLGKTEYDLTQGDSIYFDASLPHIFCNTGKDKALLLSVTSPTN